jgi:hypothetical protein
MDRHTEEYLLVISNEASGVDVKRKEATMGVQGGLVLLQKIFAFLEIWKMLGNIYTS